MRPYHLFSVLFVLLLSTLKANAIEMWVGDTKTLDVGSISHLQGAQWAISRPECIEFVTPPESYSTSVTIKAVKAINGSPCIVQCTYYYLDVDPVTGKYTYLRSGFKSWTIFVSDNSSGGGNTGGGNSDPSAFITLSASSVSCKVGNSSKPISIWTFTDFNMTWSIDNPEIANVVPKEYFRDTNTIKEAYIYGKKEGSTTLRVRGSDGSLAICNVTVNALEDGDTFEVKHENGFWEDATLIYEVISASDKSCKINSIKEYSGLKYLTLFNNVLGYDVIEIGDNAFSNRPFESINIPSSIKSIGEGAFSGCWHLKVKIADLDSWCGIDFKNPTSNPLCLQGALYLNDEMLTDIVIPSSITKIKDFAFNGFKELLSVEMPSTVTKIGNRVFQDCWSLSSIKLSDSLTEIGDEAFWQCESLTNLIIPSSLKKIGNNAFMFCGNLKKVEISDLDAWCNIDFESGGNPLSNAHLLFFNGTEINQLEIPNTVTVIKPYTFDGCTSVTSVYLPISVIEIGNCAFSNCKNLSSITCCWNTPLSIEEKVFSSNTYQTATLYVPEDSIFEYQTVAPWSNFTNILANETNSIEMISVDDHRFDLNCPYNVYDFCGTKIGSSVSDLVPGVYIIQQGNSVIKMTVK